MLGMPGGLEWIIIFCVLFLFLAPWAYALVDILRHKFEGNSQILWLLIFIPFGFLFYLMMGRAQRIDV